MASTASARSIAFPEPQKFCCNAISAQCEACKAGVSVEEICRTWVVDSSDPLSFHSRPLDGCPQNQPKPCCRANTLECQACIADVSEEEFCRRDPHSHVCPRSLITSHLILITATPLSGTLKSGMARWVPRSAAGTESGRISPSVRRTHQSLILITATPLSGTLKSGMVRWAQESAAGTESGRRSPSARRNHQSLILITATPLSGTPKSG